MAQKTFDYAGYLHVNCRSCQHEDRLENGTTIRPVVGVKVGGDYLLSCGHQQQELLIRRMDTKENRDFWNSVEAAVEEVKQLRPIPTSSPARP